MTLDREQIRQEVKKGNITHIILNGVKCKLISHKGTLCYHPNNKTTKTIFITSDVIITNDMLVRPNNEGDEVINKQAFKEISKHRKYALKDTLGLNYAKSCVEKIPSTYNEWVAQGKPSLKELSLSMTSDKKVITLEGINKEYPEIYNSTMAALKTRTEFESETVRFRGYNLSIQITFDEDTNEINGELRLRFNDNINGHNYKLINSNDFIVYESFIG